MGNKERKYHLVWSKRAPGLQNLKQRLLSNLKKRRRKVDLN